jgi:hypothetical protein
LRLLIFRSDVGIFIVMFNNERKGWEIGQRVCSGHAFCTVEAKTQVGCRPKYEISPSPENVSQFIPPLLAGPSPTPRSDEHGHPGLHLK